MLLASPDWGASGVIVLFLLVGWIILLLLVALGIFVGSRLRRRQSAPAKAFGLIIILASVFAPIFCYVAPPHLVRFAYGSYPLGRYPNGKIKEGMTMDEVQAILGAPHDRIKQGEDESYYYWIDSFGVSWFGVDFGPDKRVTHTYGN